MAAMSTMIFAQDNAIKLRIGSVLMSTGYLEYERALNEKSSVTGAFHFTKANISQLQDVFQSDGQNEGTVELATPTLSGFGLTFEYRMYTKKEGLKGFYFSPFLRHSQYTIGVETQFSEDNGDTFIGKQALTLQNTLGLGVSIGSHFNIGEHFSIDVTWIGIGASFSKLKGEITTDDKSVDFRDAAQDIKEEVESNPYLSSYEISQNKVEVTSNGFMLPIIRGNVAIGYRF